MKIYFAGSIRGGRDDKDLYLRLIEHLKRHSEVLTEHVGDNDLSHLGEAGRTDAMIYNRDMSWIQEADAIVAEISAPSLGVGYEIAKAESLGRPILCLWRSQPDKRLSAMIGGSQKIQKVIYQDFDEATEAIDQFLGTLI